MAARLEITLTVARSGVLHLEQHTGGAGGFFHGALAGVRGIVTGADWLIRLTLRAELITEGATASANLEIPQAFFPTATLDVFTGLCF